VEITGQLSKREGEVVELLLEGKSNKMIASSLGISNRTVEFHLKNIYTKLHVSTRTELILKLGNTTGKADTEKPGYSTVDGMGKLAENRETLNPTTDRAISFRETISEIGKDLKMKNVFSKHVLVGVMASLLTGYVWITVFRHFGHMSLNSIVPWIAPLVIILVLIGLSVGLIGKRNGNSLLKVFFSSLFGTGTSAFAMIPIIGLVVYPLAKLLEWLGLIDRSAISTSVTSAAVIVAMIIVWLVVGTAIGILLLSVTIKKSKQTRAGA
jgi:DNA-binding CsgD family transcriptional regulator